MILVVVSSVLLLNKCKYGYVSFDEQSYLTTAYRFVQGDRYIVDEWFPAQLWTFLIQPILKLFLLLHRTTDGIYLAFRYIYTVIMVITSIGVYCGLKKYSKSGAAVASMVYLWYAPFYISALSYNTCGIICLTSCLVLLQLNNRGRMISGLFFAGAVLCDPYLVLLYVLYTGIVVIALIYEKFNIMAAPAYLKIRNWFFFSLGCLILAFIFCVRLLSGRVNNIIISLPYVLNESGHPQKSVLYNLRTWIVYIINEGENQSAIAVIAIFCLIFAMAVYKEKIKKSHAKYIMVLLSLFVGIWLMHFLHGDECYINHLLVPLNAFALVIMTLSKNQKIHDMFWGFWLPGIGYSLCLHCSSNQNYYAIASAHIICLIATIVILFMFFSDMINEESNIWNSLAIVSVVFLLSINVSSEVYLRLTGNFFQENDELSELLEEGPLKGIWVSQEYANTYNNRIEDLKESVKIFKDGGSIVYYTGDIWAYLYTGDLRCAYYSTLSSTEYSDYVANRFKAYYEMHEQLPDLIYVDQGYKGHDEIIAYFADIYGYTKHITVKNNFLLKR